MNTIQISKSKLTAILATLLTASAYGQSTPNIGDALRQAVPIAPVAPSSQTLPQLGERIEPPMKQLPGGGVQIQVKQFQFKGNRVIAESVLQKTLEQDVNKTYTLAELENLIAKITRLYRESGYFVARAYLPEQKIVDGVLTVQIVEGRYGKFILENQSLVNDKVLQGMLDDVKQYDIVSLDTLERAMLIINDTPGSQVVKADVLPGEAVGTSDFVVGTIATKPFDGFTLIDNHGTKATGQYRLSSNVNWNSPTGSGDRLSVTSLISEDKGLASARFAYSTSLSSSGLRGEVAIGKTSYEVNPKIFSTSSAPKVYGVADVFEMGLTYPIRRITSQTIQASMQLSHKDLSDFVDLANTQKKSDTITFGIFIRDSSPIMGVDGVTQFGLSLTHGNLQLSGQNKLDDQASGGPKTDGHFSKLYLDLSRVDLLANNFTMTAVLKAQQTLNKNLDGSERMGVTGVAGVMAYPSSELSGTNAQSLRFELAQALPVFAGFRSQWLAFANYGRAQNLKNDPWKELKDVGLGWVGQTDDGWLVKTYLARRVGGTPSVAEPDFSKTKLWVQAGYVF